MDRARTYTLDEIEQESGVDKRTIAYWVQEGLLPKVGRRGPRTRYPQTYLDRILFIKKIRDEQDRGRLGSMTLSDIRDMLDELSEHRIAHAVAGREELAAVLSDAGVQEHWSEMASRQNRLDMLRSAAPRRRIDASEDPSEPPPDVDGTEALVLDLDDGPPRLELVEVAPSRPSPSQSPATRGRKSSRKRHDRLSSTLSRLAEAAGGRSRIRLRSSEHWTRAEITPNLVITARNLDEEDAELLEEAARLLRWKILRARRGDG